MLLAMSAGRHRLGYAIFRHGHLVHHGLAQLKQFRTEAELKRAIEKFLAVAARRFQLEEAAARRLNKQQQRNVLLAAIDKQIEACCGLGNLPLTRYEGEFVNGHFCGPGQRPTNERAVRAILRRYPHFAAHHDTKKSWQKHYYQQLFQAVAVGLVHIEEAQIDEER